MWRRFWYWFRNWRDDKGKVSEQWLAEYGASREGGAERP
jgi:hypothetical protein